MQDPENPGILYNHDNEYLHYQDDWYIVDYEPEQFICIYYRGRNDAWVSPLLHLPPYLPISVLGLLAFLRPSTANLPTYLPTITYIGGIWRCSSL